MLFHSFPANGMSSLKELGIFLLVTFATYLRFDRRFLEFGLVVIFMTGDTIDSLLGMLAIDPGQKDASCVFLVTGEAIPDLLFRMCHQRRMKHENKDDQETHFLKHYILPVATGFSLRCLYGAT
jgi:hypothetical protein